MQVSIKYQILWALRQSIITTGFMPPNTINIWAVILPWIEFIAGALLIMGIKVKPSSLIISGLLVVFMVVLAVTAIERN